MKMTSQTGFLWRAATARLPTKWGMFHATGFEREFANGIRRVETALAIVMGDLTLDAPLLRIHSQCFTGEVLGSLRCDCGDQLSMAMQTIAEEGRGLVIYEYQEGRGIGLMAKLQSYELQDVGIDTVEANHALGFKADCRDFSLSAAILGDLGVSRVRLLTNNPHKVRALLDADIEIVARIPCEVAPTSYSLSYLLTKQERMGHALSLAHRHGRGRMVASRSAASFNPRQRHSASDIFGLYGGDQNPACDVARPTRGIDAQI
ncbi:MAG TPA: GTP cyclohydrolase II [Xanthobacteraceae bacterium]|nr:GTP cyclohydrolase II [Xanthobacteraceae bacterium]